jgi:hypothetical protein
MDSQNLGQPPNRSSSRLPVASSPALMRRLACFREERGGFTYVPIPYRNPKSLTPFASVCGK